MFDRVELEIVLGALVGCTACGSEAGRGAGTVLVEDVLTEEQQAALTPEAVTELLQDGSASGRGGRGQHGSPPHLERRDPSGRES